MPRNGRRQMLGKVRLHEQREREEKLRELHQELRTSWKASLEEGPFMEPDAETDDRLDRFGNAPNEAA